MDFFNIETFAFIGFLLGAYSVVANDSIQTLGTFLSSNSDKPWWVLWIYASCIICAVIVYAFFAGGDIAYGRLNSLPYPETGIEWWHAIPPLFLLMLTRYGIPVSTTFLVLTIFALSGGAATDGVLPKMLLKSGIGYVVAFAAGGLVYLLIAKRFETWVSKTANEKRSNLWTVLQWSSTAFLWSQWLIQDLANIFIFLPRTTEVAADGSVAVRFDPSMLIFAVVVMIALHAYIFKTRGGEIQKIVTTKVNTVDVRAATLVDFIYAIILVIFKEISDIPMSTTWVFLGLLAGRELAIAWTAGLRSRNEALFDVMTDVFRAFIGLVVSVVLAIALPALATGKLPGFLS